MDACIRQWENSTIYTVLVALSDKADKAIQIHGFVDIPSRCTLLHYQRTDCCLVRVFSQSADKTEYTPNTHTTIQYNNPAGTKDKHCSNYRQHVNLNAHKLQETWLNSAPTHQQTIGDFLCYITHYTLQATSQCVVRHYNHRKHGSATLYIH